MQTLNMSLKGNPVKFGDGPASVIGDENRRTAAKAKRISIKANNRPFVKTLLE